MDGVRLFLRATLTTFLFRACAADVDVYFGCGCFWHVQYAFVGLEQRLLNRTGTSITARTAYAGAIQTGPGGIVCYHNAEGVADYADLGYAEAVSLSVPEESFEAFASTFWHVCPRGNRKDTMDYDHQYRSVVGLPGGMKSPLSKRLASSAGAARLVAGLGGDGDTFDLDMVWVYDTNEFPARVAEKYHQFHDDFMRSPYDQQYHALQQFASKTRCPGDADFTLLAEASHPLLAISVRSALILLTGLSVVGLLVMRWLPGPRDGRQNCPIEETREEQYRKL